MKKYLIVILAAVVAAAVIFSCKKSDDTGGGGEVATNFTMRVSLYDKNAKKYAEIFGMKAVYKSDKLSSVAYFEQEGEDTTEMSASVFEKKIKISGGDNDADIYFTTPYSWADSMCVETDGDNSNSFLYVYDDNGMLKSFKDSTIDSGSLEVRVSISSVTVKNGDYTGFELKNHEWSKEGGDTTWTYTISYSEELVSDCPAQSPDFLGNLMNSLWYGHSKYKADDGHCVAISLSALPVFAQKATHKMTTIHVKKSCEGYNQSSDITPVYEMDNNNRVKSIEMDVDGTVLAPIFANTGYSETFSKIKVEFVY